jgi:hypothetical protein
MEFLTYKLVSVILSLPYPANAYANIADIKEANASNARYVTNGM